VLARPCFMQGDLPRTRASPLAMLLLISESAPLVLSVCKGFDAVLAPLTPALVAAAAKLFSGLPGTGVLTPLEAPHGRGGTIGGMRCRLLMSTAASASAGRSERKGDLVAVRSACTEGDLVADRTSANGRADCEGDRKHRAVAGEGEGSGADRTLAGERVTLLV